MKKYYSSPSGLWRANLGVNHSDERFLIELNEFCCGANFWKLATTKLKRKNDEKEKKDKEEDAVYAQQRKDDNEEGSRMILKEIEFTRM